MIESRVKLLEDLVSPLNETVKNGTPLEKDDVFKSYNHVYMTMIASSLCNISDKLDILVEKMKELDQEDELKAECCRNCKQWKDSDGEYRRGINAESQCPINRREVFEGNGYCFLYEPQESEVNND